ncbi:MAG: c-type cytochrome [Nitrospirae bacterium]|nr:c-type cytochrome [Nitrospirota bacterium]
MDRKKILIISALTFLTLIYIFVIGTSNGAELFRKEGCIDCHSFKGRGGSIGPELTGVSKRRSRKWMTDQIRDPQSHNPDTRMPSFSHLSIIETYSLVRYLSE